MLKNVLEYLKDRFFGRTINIVLAAAAVGIVAVIVLSNSGTGVAASCPAQPDKASTIDAVASGNLAALQTTGTGRKYSDLQFVDDTGRPITLADFEGRMLLVNFWATWCVPCREEMPALNAIEAEYGGEDFMVVTIDLDVGADGMEKARLFLSDMALYNLPLYADPSFEAFERLKQNAVAVGLPATLLLDENACELAVLQGPAPWDTPDGQRVVETLIALKNV
jgi:thiol-disulfide isomerase/thioredoxin